MKIVVVVLVIVAIGFIGIKYYIFRIGEPVNLKVSNSFFHHSMKNIIVYSPMGNWFGLDYQELDADVETFQPINEDFGKDNSSVFWRGKKQLVDHNTFEIDTFDIIKDKNHVYRTNGKKYGFLEIIQDADPKTYQLLDPSAKDYGTSNWFKDANAVYYKSKRVEVDAKTFKHINNTIAVDAHTIYAIVTERGEDKNRLEVNEVIPKHEMIQGEIHAVNESYAQIGNTIVSTFSKDEFELHSFESIQTTKAIDYWKIIVNTTLINKGIVCPGIDVATFEVLQNDFSKDKNTVYFDCKKINSVIPSSFEILSNEYSKDDKNVYYRTLIVKGANPKTFKKGYSYDVWEDGAKKYKEGQLFVENTKQK